MPGPVSPWAGGAGEEAPRMPPGPSGSRRGCDPRRPARERPPRPAPSLPAAKVSRYERYLPRTAVSVMAFQYGAAAPGELSTQAATPRATAFWSGVSLTRSPWSGTTRARSPLLPRPGFSSSSAVDYSSETSVTSRNPTSTYPFEGSSSRRFEMRRSVGPSIQDPPLTMTAGSPPAVSPSWWMSTARRCPPCRTVPRRSSRTRSCRPARARGTGRFR